MKKFLLKFFGSISCVCTTPQPAKFGLFRFIKVGGVPVGAHRFGYAHFVLLAEAKDETTDVEAPSAVRVEEHCIYGILFGVMIVVRAWKPRWYAVPRYQVI